MRTVSTIFGLMMVACLAAAACTVNSTESGDDTSKKDAGKSTGTDDDDDDTTDKDAGKDAEGDDDDEATCDECVASKCSDQVAACQDNEDCVALASCVQACDADDDDCFDQCETDHADGLDDATALSECVSTDCSSECAP